ncbi:hypothetical protein QFC22_000914 [Naganishia vaughanmartiniae]|uniref:Uncharacterized protein n=1 Tax=Naganishia vaughanmartiniae TaxID=1424756 RepID=A0ACC2XJG6_9TREE|nr:hypothetical protein QFC22_000914 [Naganishia vaughanmartiniae]
MSRTNPFAKHKPVTTSTLSSAEPTTPSRPDTPKRQFSGFKQHLQSLQKEGRIPFSPHRREDEHDDDEDEGRVDGGSAAADEVIVPRLEYAKISTQFRASHVPSLTPTQQHHTPSAATPSSSRWRLLYRGGLEVGAERYTLPGIAFCARIRIPPIPTPAVTAVPPCSVPLSPTPSAQESAQSVDIGGKELAMREEGSYFSSLASVAGSSATTMTTINGNSSMTDDRQSSSSYTSSSMGNQTTNARLRPSLQYQPTTTTNPTTNTPSGNNDTPNKAFTPAGPTGDTDLCLSLESMKGRKTLRVRGVERLQDDDLEVPEEDGDDEDGAVHV